jgi:hypothetical protein
VAEKIYLNFCKLFRLKDCWLCLQTCCSNLERFLIKKLMRSQVLFRGNQISCSMNVEKWNFSLNFGIARYLFEPKFWFSTKVVFIVSFVSWFSHFISYFSEMKRKRKFSYLKKYRSSVVLDKFAKEIHNTGSIIGFLNLPKFGSSEIEK